MVQLRLFLSICLTLSLTACGSASKSRDNEDVASAPVKEEKITPREEEVLSILVTPEKTENEIAALEESLQNIRESAGRELRSTQRPRYRNTLPIESNARVRKWIYYFAVVDQERFQRFLNRGAAFQSMVSERIRKQELPEELYYLAMIESGYVTHAYSHASAVGMWQFMRPTAKQFGLISDGYVDERKDPIRATDAALRYLRALYNRFQSWPLAIAAYNCGEGRIEQAIRRGKTRDYWELVENRILPAETRDYVPKLYAAVMIGRNPEKFGFQIDRSIQFPKVKAVAVPSPVRLLDIARTSKIDVDSLELVNPHLVRGVTPANKARYVLWVPQGKEAERVLKSQHLFSRLQLSRGRALATTRHQPAAQRPRVVEKLVQYRVRAGDTLGSVAKKFRMTVVEIKQLNRLNRNRLFAGEQLKLTKQRG